MDLESFLQVHKKVIPRWAINIFKDNKVPNYIN